MQVTVGNVAALRERSETQSLSPVVASALYYLGLMVETVGIALVPAFGWLLVGALTAAGGVAIAVIGLHHMPDDGQPVSRWSMLGHYAVRGWWR